MPSKHAVAAVVKSAVVALTLFIAACTNTTPGPPDDRQPAATALTPSQLERKAATATPASASLLYQQASAGYFAAGELAAARSAFALIEPGILPVTALNDFHLLAAELALTVGDWRTADEALRQINASPTNRSLHNRMTRLEAGICGARQDFVCAANLLMAAAEDDPVWNEQIWTWIRQASGREVREQASLQQGIPGSWWVLQLELMTSQTSDEQKARLLRWQSRNPDHPLNQAMPSSLVLVLAADPGPKQIALLLPLSGSYARAGEAVRDGFLAAYLHAGLETVLRIRVYDSQSAPLPQLYEQILADSTELIIGPLQKPLVGELNALNPDIPVLALNYLDEDQVAAKDFLQLGLAIEDEARSIAERLKQDGAERVLVLHNYEDWSVRASRVLSSEWDQPLTLQAFTDVRTITEAIGAAMQVAASRARRDELSKVLGVPLEFLPRARGDLDAVVALIGNVEANSLVPALRFHFAEHLPVYASSQTIRGTRRDQRREFEGFHIAELPLFLTGSSLARELEAPFSLSTNPFSSLYALGADGFAVSARFEGMRTGSTTRLPGNTGELKLGANGQIRRTLDWGVIRSGTVTPDARPRPAEVTVISAGR